MYPTPTSREQTRCEEDCLRWLSGKVPFSEAESSARFSEDGEPLLLREPHKEFLMKVFSGLPGGYVSLDASRTWLVYWTVHSLVLLDEPLPEDVQTRVIDFLKRCMSIEGGLGGGPSQLPHCAPTYSGTLALLSFGSAEAYAAINRPALYKFFLNMKQSCGAFSMHHDGEVDVRGTYTVIAIASLLNMLTPQLTEGVVDWLLTCQTYEGGFGGEPGTEAHGGYAFCAVAALSVLKSLHLCDMEALKHWLIMRQMPVEGGFKGVRTSLLMDAIRSGKAPRLPWSQSTKLHVGCPQSLTYLSSGEDAWFFNRIHLQEYVLICCQEARGGLIDKPGKSRDYYHTCYCLSGLSISQHGTGGAVVAGGLLGPPSNVVAPTSPVYNIRLDLAQRALDWFGKLANDHETLLK